MAKVRVLRRTSMKCLVRRNARMKYESPVYTAPEVMAKVKVFYEHTRVHTNRKGMTIADLNILLTVM